MSDANELLAKLRYAVGPSGDWTHAWDRMTLLDTQCKAGNLPDEWRIDLETRCAWMWVEEHEERIAEKDERMAALEAEVAKLSTSALAKTAAGAIAKNVELIAEVERLRALLVEAADVICGHPRYSDNYDEPLDQVCAKMIAVVGSPDDDIDLAAKKS